MNITQEQERKLVFIYKNFVERELTRAKEIEADADKTISHLIRHERGITAKNLFNAIIEALEIDLKRE